MQIVGPPKTHVFPMLVRCEASHGSAGSENLQETKFCGRLLKIWKSDIQKQGNAYGIVCKACGAFIPIDAKALEERVKEVSPGNQKNWTKKETGRSWDPYYYECRKDDLLLQLNPPYESGPWHMRLSWSPLKENGIQKADTITKEPFRFNNDESSEDKKLWENINDLEYAKTEAFALAEEHVLNNLNYWVHLWVQLEELKQMTNPDGEN